ncbi:MAG: hypothetical protein JNM07_10810 [Phycisphaerae bacterium]|nr:hypothetical protein [Phycisphaerae bacterium]
MVVDLISQSGVLNSASSGLALAAHVTARLQRVDTVEIDMRSVVRVTPSFANAFVMTMLSEFPNAFPQRVRLVHAQELVDLAFRQAADRYARGIRLSSQAS